MPTLNRTFRDAAPAILFVFGCGPDLNREDGRLVVNVVGWPPASTRIELEVQAEEGEPSLTARAPEAPPMQLVVESVPAGPVEVRVRAGTQAETLAKTRRGTNLEPDSIRTLTVDLGSVSNEVSLYSDTWTTSLQLGEPQGGMLFAEGSLDELGSFVTAARLALGQDPGRFQIQQARLTLFPSVDSTYEELPDLWEFDVGEEVSLQVVGSVPAQVGTGRAEAGSTLTFVPVGGLDALTEELQRSAPMRLRVGGVTELDDGEIFPPSLRLEVESTWIARP